MGKRKWVGEVFASLMHDDWKTFHQKWPLVLYNTYKGKRGYYKAKISRGELVMPPSPEIGPEEEKRLMKTWEVAMRGADGEWDTTTLHSYEHYRDLNDTINLLPPIKVYPTKTKPRAKSKERTALIYTDMQVWEGRNEDGALYHFHDVDAIDVVNAIGKEEQPDEVVLVGDFVDFPVLSKFKQEKAFEDTFNPSLLEMQRQLAQIRANNPNAKITLLEGNHEKRLRRYIYDRARELYGLEALDIRNLLHLKDVEIDYVDGYPNGRYWLNDRLKVVHGETVKQLGKTVTNLIRNDDTSSITGHIHRFEMATRTIPSRHAGRLIMAASFGTLSRIDGSVPSYHSSHDDQGRQMLHIEQWQQGAGWVSYQEGDRPFDIQPIIINTFDNYHTRFNGKTYGK